MCFCCPFSTFKTLLQNECLLTRQNGSFKQNSWQKLLELAISQLEKETST